MKVTLEKERMVKSKTLPVITVIAMISIVFPERESSGEGGVLEREDDENVGYERRNRD